MAPFLSVEKTHRLGSGKSSPPGTLKNAIAYCKNLSRGLSDEAETLAKINTFPGSLFYVYESLYWWGGR